MPREFYRSQRVEQQLHRLLGDLIQRELKDPRLGFVTITAVEVSRDIKHAKVYFSLLADNDDPETSRQTLQGAAGFLRGQLGRDTMMRSVPELKFVYDNSLREGERLSKLIDNAVDTDSRHAVDAADADPESSDQDTQ